MGRVRMIVRRRPPMWASPLWLIVVFVAAGTVAAPFYALWHPLGWLVAAAAYCIGFGLLVGYERRRSQRRVIAPATARPVVPSRRD